MQKQIEPTYLRYIYDGLKNNSIHHHNASSLPDGFVGLYEEVFDESISVLERQKNIRLFALWALLKKDVKISFVSQVLDEKEGNVQEFVLKYSKWFNTPEPGKLILYHERLRMYIIQKAGGEAIIELLRLICNLDINENEYLQLYKLDHQIVLSHLDSRIYRFTKEFVLQIEYNQSDKKELYSAKKRWFENASILGGYYKDFSFLKQVYLKYNKFLTPQLSLEDDWILFELNGVDFLLNKADSFFINKQVAFMYLCYYLNLIIQDETSIIDSNKDLILLVSHLNKILNEFISEGEYILNKNYFSYLNGILTRMELPLLEIDKGLDSFPKLMSEDGFGSLFDYGFDENNKVIYFGDRDWKIAKLKKILVSSFSDIGGIQNSPEIAKSVIEKLLSLLPEGNIKAVESFLKKVRSKVLFSETKHWDDLLSFDAFVFDVFKFISSKYPKYNFTAWQYLFTCSTKLWQQNISFWKMLVDINLEGDINELYRNYKYGSNEIAKTDLYIIDEMGFVSLVLSLNDRNHEIPELIKKSLSLLMNKSYYNHAVDTMSSSYLIDSIKGKDLNLINKYFHKNDILSSSTYLQQICELLSKKIEFLDLIDFVYYDYQLQSEVSENYWWSFDIIESIKSKYNSREFLQYVIKGFDTYIKIMGQFDLDEIKHPDDCPPENKWKIEWWVMCNFYASICEVLKNEEKNLELFKKTVESIFLANGYDSNINLKVGLDRYSIYRKERVDNREFYLEYHLHQNPIHYLMSFKDNMNNKEIISKIAGSINSGNLNVKN